MTNTHLLGVTPKASLLLRERKEIWARIISHGPNYLEDRTRLFQVEKALSAMGILPPQEKVR
jgi:hypothetical protein